MTAFLGWIFSPIEYRMYNTQGYNDMSNCVLLPQIFRSGGIFKHKKVIFKNLDYCNYSVLSGAFRDKGNNNSPSYQLKRILNNLGLKPQMTFENLDMQENA